MKNFKRIFSMAVALIMIVATMSAMFVTASAESVEVGDVFAPKKLGADVATDGCFYIAGIDPDGKKCDVTYDAGNKQFNANGKRVFVAKTIEKGSVYPHASNTDYTSFYARPNDGYKSAIIFKAPVAGTYDLDILFCKIYHQYGGAAADTGCLSTVTILKNGEGTALYNETSAPVTDPTTNLPQAIVNQDFAYTGSVELAEGDEIWITIGADANYSNQMNIIRCNVTYSAVATPSTPSAPETADGIMISVLVAVAAAGVAVVASKKRH